MWSAITATYRNAWRFALALPLLAALAVGFEALQHVVEWSIGMYAGRDGALRVQYHPARMVTGIAKVLVIHATGYWVARFVLSGGSAKATLRGDAVALRRYLGVVAFGLVVGVGGLVLAAILPGSGLPRAVTAVILLVVLVGSSLFSIALAYWYAGAAIAEPGATFMASLRNSGGSLFWGIAVTIAVILPPMALHYAFGGLAIGKAAPVTIAILAADTLVVGFLSLLIGATTVTIARRIAARANLLLALPA